jgi:hypothetical protein
MADFRAITAVCETAVQLLRSSYRPEDFNDHELDFRVFQAADFSNKSRPINAGVSLFLYRIYPNGSPRLPAGRLRANGSRQQPPLPVDLHFLLTTWGKDSTLQHTIAGWMMRVMEDNAILPAAMLNAVVPGCFHSDENVEISLAELSNEDLLRLWDGLVQNIYQVSVPYVARNLRIESALASVTGAPVQTRVTDYAQIEQP